MLAVTNSLACDSLAELLQLLLRLQGHAFGAPGAQAPARLRAWARAHPQGKLDGRRSRHRRNRERGRIWPHGAAAWPTALARKRTARAAAAAPLPRTRRQAVTAVTHPG